MEGFRLPDYHVHLENGPYEVSWVTRFLEAACDAGLNEIGFVEHGHRFREAEHILDFESARAECTQLAREYVDLVQSSRSLGYPIEVKIGVEMDFVPGKEKEIADFLKPYPWDFVIGSVHWDGETGLDYPDHRWKESDLFSVWRKYFDLVKSMACSGLYDIVGHFDVIKVNGQILSEALWDDVGVRLALRAVSEAGLCIEASSAGLRKPVKEIYPSPSLLNAARKLAIPVTLSSDAHEPEEVGSDFDLLRDWVRSAGYAEITYFERRRPRRVDLP